MQLIVLAPGPTKIVAELEDREGKRCSLLDDLRSLGTNYARMRAGLIVAIEHVAVHGHRQAWIEAASTTDPRVYKFVKGDLRLYFCIADGLVLVCSQCAVKKTQKTEKRYVTAAVALLERYRKSVADGTLKEEMGHERLREIL